MRFERKKNVIKSVGVGFFSKLLDVFLQFALRTILINTLGILYLGLNSLFASIIGILSLTELGFGSVIIFSMYKPIAEDNIPVIKSLLAFYRKCYKVMGLIILISGVMLTPFITLIINGEYPTDTNIYVLYLLNLLNTVVSYFLFAYKSSILEAYQRNDLVSIVDGVTNLSKCVIQIVLLIILKNYYAYLIVVPCATILRNVLLHIVTIRRYPLLTVKGAAPISKEGLEEIKTQVKGVILHKLGNAVFQYADSVIISAFFGLSILGKYNNYYYILMAVSMFMVIVANSLIPGVGNSIAIESIDRNRKIFGTINEMYYWIATISAVCFVVLYQPFIELWIGTEMMLPFSVALLLALLFFVLQVNNAVGVYKGALGMWWEDRYRPIISAGVNLALNIWLSKVWGLEGVIVSSIVANIFVDFPYVTIILFKNYFKSGGLKYIIGQYVKIVLMVPVIYLAYVSAQFVCCDGYIGLVLKLLVCFIVGNMTFILINSSRKEFRDNVVPIVKTIKRKIGIIYEKD